MTFHGSIEFSFSLDTFLVLPDTFNDLTTDTTDRLAENAAVEVSALVFITCHSASIENGENVLGTSVGGAADVVQETNICRRRADEEHNNSSVRSSLILWLFPRS